MYKIMHRYLYKGDIKIPKRYIIKSSTSLSIRAMQIKTITKYYFTPTKLAKIKKTQIINKYYKGSEEIGILKHC